MSAHRTIIAGIQIPDSQITREATELVQDTSTPLLFHDLGLVEGHLSEHERFEIDVVVGPRRRGGRDLLVDDGAHRACQRKQSVGETYALFPAADASISTQRAGGAPKKAGAIYAGVARVRALPP